MDIQTQLNNNRKKSVVCIIPSSKDPLPGHTILNSFQQICPKAAFFSLIPPPDDLQYPPASSPTSSSTVRQDFPIPLTTLCSDENKKLQNADLQNKAANIYSSYSCSSTQISNLFEMTKSKS